MRDDKIKDMVESEFTPISTEAGQELADEIGAKAFIESSAKTSYNLDKLFHQAIDLALEFHYGSSEPVSGSSDNSNTEPKKEESKPEESKKEEPTPVESTNGKDSKKKGSKVKESKSKLKEDGSKKKKKKWWNR